MTAIAKIVFPAVLAFAAIGASAQTIETDYPAIAGTGTIAVSPTFQASAGSQAPSQSAPYLIQSNAEGVRVNPDFVQPSTLTRAQVQREAVVSVPQSGHNA